MAFGKEIKRIREASGITAQSMVALIGIDNLQRYKNWEARDGNPKYEDRKLIEAFFGIELEDIIKLKKIPLKLLNKKELPGIDENTEDAASFPPFIAENEIESSKNTSVMTLTENELALRASLNMSETNRMLAESILKNSEARLIEAETKRKEAEASSLLSQTNQELIKTLNTTVNEQEEALSDLIAKSHLLEEFVFEELSKLGGKNLSHFHDSFRNRLVSYVEGMAQKGMRTHVRS
jgi:transcriptional regulator with XRE-family HTH domain